MEKESTRSSKNSSVPERLIRKLQKSALPPEFYARHTLEVARDLLGKIVIVDSRGLTAARIVEVEAYRADDLASHSARGKTPRSAPLFEQPGRAYVYFIYGMHEMLNFVTEPDGDAGAVLIRAVEPIYGEDLMARRRKGVREADWTNGPGRLCRALGIRMSHNRASLQGPKIWVVDDGWRGPSASMSVSPRVGISQAKEEPWRFFLTGHPQVSRAPQNRAAKVCLKLNT